jgi:hypothetical protein
MSRFLMVVRENAQTDHKTDMVPDGNRNTILPLFVRGGGSQANKDIEVYHQINLGKID